MVNECEMNQQQYQKEVMDELEIIEAAHRVLDATDCAADSALLKE